MSRKKEDMANEKLIRDTHEEFSSMSMDMTKENAKVILEKLHLLIMKICPQLNDEERDYFRNRFEELNDALGFEEGAFRKVYYAVVSQVSWKLKAMLK